MNSEQYWRLKVQIEHSGRKSDRSVANNSAAWKSFIPAQGLGSFCPTSCPAWPYSVSFFPLLSLFLTLFTSCYSLCFGPSLFSMDCKLPTWVQMSKATTHNRVMFFFIFSQLLSSQHKKRFLSQWVGCVNVWFNELFKNYTHLCQLADCNAYASWFHHLLKKKLYLVLSPSLKTKLEKPLLWGFNDYLNSIEGLENVIAIFWTEPLKNTLHGEKFLKRSQ